MKSFFWSAEKLLFVTCLVGSSGLWHLSFPSTFLLDYIREDIYFLELQMPSLIVVNLAFDDMLFLD